MPAGNASSATMTMITKEPKRPCEMPAFCGFDASGVEMKSTSPRSCQTGSDSMKMLTSSQMRKAKEITSEMTRKASQMRLRQSVVLPSSARLTASVVSDWFPSVARRPAIRWLPSCAPGARTTR